MVGKAIVQQLEGFVDEFLVDHPNPQVKLVSSVSDDGPFLPKGFVHPRTHRLISSTYLKPVPRGGKYYSCNDNGVIPIVEFDADGYLKSEDYFATLILNAAYSMNVPVESPLHLTWHEFIRLVRTAPMIIHSCRALIQNAGRAIILVQKAYEAKKLQEPSYIELSAALKQNFIETYSAMEGLSPDFEVPGLPESFSAVTVQLKEIMDASQLDLTAFCTFNDAVSNIPIPIVLHPALDVCFEDLQVSLVHISKSFHQLTPLAAYVQCAKALCEVNESLFQDPSSSMEKANGLNYVLAEFRRCYWRNEEHTKSSAWWMSSTLFGPHFLSDFEDLLGYLQQCIQLITRKPYDLKPSILLPAVEEDLKSLDKFWGLNIQAAITDRCKNLRVCGALNDFPQLVRNEIQIVGDRAAGMFAAKRAWQMLQSASSGSYEHRALMYALFEIRRALHGSLQEWELLEPEVTLGDVLGEGGSASVYTAEFLGGPAAVKVFKSPLTSEPGSMSQPARLSNSLSTQDMDSYVHKRELQTWFRLSHPNVMPFVGCCLSSSNPMIITPIAPNGSARAYRDAHPNVDWLKILAQIASGVHYLHSEASIIHGDLKGRNVLMDGQGIPKISDFGLAMMTENAHGSVNLSGGTTQWMAPELLSGKSFLTYECDIYSLGMTFYELWFNKNPFDLMEPDLVQEMVVEAGMRPYREAEPAMPNELWKLVESCWVEEPAGRPSSGSVNDSMQDISGYRVEDVAGSPIQHPNRRNSGDGKDSEVDIDSLVCAPLHAPPEFPDREEFPFISSGYRVSFAVRREWESYVGRTLGKATRLQYLETSQEGIEGSFLEHPVKKIIFRIHTATEHESAVVKAWRGPVDGTRFEAVVRRRDANGSWKDVPEATQTLLDLGDGCNSTVAHVIVLDSTSKVAGHAIAGDKIALYAIPDIDQRLTIKAAEIEMHVLLRSAKL